VKFKRGRHATPSTAMTVIAAAAPAVVLAGAAVVSTTGPQPALADTGSFPVAHDIASVQPAQPSEGLAAHTAAVIKSVSLTARHARPATYTVKSGDTLSGIAQAVYGNSGDWPGIYVDNKNVDPNPNLIYPGQHLKIPAEGSSVGAPAPASAPQVEATYVPKHAAPAPVQSAPVQQAPVQQAPVQDSQVNPSDYSGFQECVISHESGGNADIWNATGHWGLYQFSESTWVEFGGPASEFGNASVAEQNQVFENAMASPGGENNWAPYDGC
jgi:LysM repeat protein